MNENRLKFEYIIIVTIIVIIIIVIIIVINNFYYVFKTKKQTLDAVMFLKQLNDSNQSFKLIKTRIFESCVEI